MKIIVIKKRLTLFRWCIASLWCGHFTDIWRHVNRVFNFRLSTPLSRNLYTSKMDVTEEQFNHYIKHLEIPCLSQEVSEIADGLLTDAECKESLDSFSGGKSPGEDGFAVEFYSKFF